jgi:hypothetical protein
MMMITKTSEYIMKKENETVIGITGYSDQELNPGDTVGT